MLSVFTFFFVWKISKRLITHSLLGNRHLAGLTQCCLVQTELRALRGCLLKVKTHTVRGKEMLVLAVYLTEISLHVCSKMNVISVHCCGFI